MKVFKKKKMSQSFKKIWDSLRVEETIQKEVDSIVGKDENLNGASLIFDYESHSALYMNDVDNVTFVFSTNNWASAAIKGSVSFPIQKSQLIPIVEGIKRYLVSLGFIHLSFLARMFPLEMSSIAIENGTYNPDVKVIKESTEY